MKTLKEQRKKLGITQAVLADRLCVHLQFISNIERGVAGLPPRHFKQVSKILRIPLKDLIEEYVQRTEKKLKKAFGLK